MPYAKKPHEALTTLSKSPHGSINSTQKNESGPCERSPYHPPIYPAPKATGTSPRTFGDLDQNY